METIKIAGVKREAFGKKESKSIRKQGQVPCVIYGNGETVHFSVDARSLKPLIYTPQSFLIEFDIEGKKEVGVMREVQYHPVTDQVLHADFFHVIPGKPISIDVPVKLTGNSEGVKQGGKLILSKRKVRISATMENLPDEIVVDVTTLGPGQEHFRRGPEVRPHHDSNACHDGYLRRKDDARRPWRRRCSRSGRCSQEIVRSHTGFLTNILLRNLRGMRQDIFTLNSCEIEIPDRRAGQYRRRVRRNPA